ncbi:hypothetical protein DEA98_06810 [Brucella pseudogrignonensis]|uniref:DUF2786 domain-containing protein n=1 Tax=Brucella pseudogrignonensis TaxID=419475 RepID=A0A7Y3T7U8_9HYPH|nr:DUF2786 domain-containing protein [Brucella pseudogrignonensis]MCM0751172.1 hypothetical protein [Brucella pseudogrignonensis]NNV22674.1 DUF2786 domain-containing protein [Brucella pseudogrignonensis]
MISENIRRRINALRERTTARGFTEAEAMEAAAKVAELMREHGLHDSDLEMTQEAAAMNGSARSIRSKLWSTIARCTNTAALLSSSLDGRVVIYIGKEPGPEIAAYLHDVCDTAISNEIKRFKKGDFYRRRRSTTTRKQAVADFSAGLTVSLNRQLLLMFKSGMCATEQRYAEIERERRFPDTRTVKPTTYKSRFDHALYAGAAAADNVNISHGVRGRESQRLIGGAK